MFGFLTAAPLSAILVSTLSAAPIPGKTPAPDPIFSLTLEKPWGSTSYDLEHTGPDTNAAGVIGSAKIRSELNFPVDPFRIAMGFSSYRSENADSLTYLRTDIGFWCAVSPSFSKMRDEDWAGSEASDAPSNSISLIKISDTYSSVHSLLLGGGLHRELMEIHPFREPLLLGIGLEGRFIAYELFGLSGRQVRPDGSGWDNVEIPGSEKIGSYHTYSLQSSLDFRTGKKLLGLDWEARIHPLLFVHSDDDHMLRKKEITMDCWGAGAAVEASLPLADWSREPAPVARWVPFLRAELERTWGSMRQTYYADSPDTPEDETGRSISGIATTVDLWLVGAGLHFNL